VWSFLDGTNPSVVVHQGVSEPQPPEEAQRKRDPICGVCQGKQQTCIDRNTRHSHPWSDVVGREGVSGWECTGGLRTGGREGEESVDGVRWE